jgi:hypothetical protein
VGITVYGTNTEQENLRFGPCRDGDEVEVGYRFNCNLCPGEYTITVASHDPSRRPRSAESDSQRCPLTHSTSAVI